MGRVVNMKVKGDFKKTEGFLSGLVQRHYRKKLEHYGELGVQALQEATPKDTGLTAASWSYEIVEEEGRVALWWRNSNVNNGVPIAILLQYGHGTGTGGWVEGIDYINPTLRPIFNEIAQAAWKEVVG